MISIIQRHLSVIYKNHLVSDISQRPYNHKYTDISVIYKGSVIRCLQRYDQYNTEAFVSYTPYNQKYSNIIYQINQSLTEVVWSVICGDCIKYSHKFTELAIQRPFNYTYTEAVLCIILEMTLQGIQHLRFILIVKQARRNRVLVRISQQ